MEGNKDCPYCHQPDFLPVRGTNPLTGICPDCGLYRLRVRLIGEKANRVPHLKVSEVEFPDPPETTVHSSEIAFPSVPM